MAIPKKRKLHDLLLAMGGTEERLQLVLGLPESNGYTLLASRQWTVPGESIKFLVPGLQQTLVGFGLGTESIAQIACVRGPGSFTGLRLVLAAAEGLAAGKDIPLAGIDYLPVLASGPAPLISGTLHVLTYARRGLVYMQSFDCPTLKELAPLASLTLDEAAQHMAKLGPNARLMGSGLRKNPDFFNELSTANPGYFLLDERWDNPSPEVLLAAAAAARFSQNSIDPVYVRPTDAEDNLDTIAAKRGLDPTEAKHKLEELRKQ